MRHRLRSMATLALLVCLYMIEGSSRGSGMAGSIPDRTGCLRQVRSIILDAPGTSHPAGLAYSARLGAFIVLNALDARSTAPANLETLVLMTPREERIGSLALVGGAPRPLDMTVDGRSRRLLALDQDGRFLIETLIADAGSARRHSRFDISHFGIQDPQGMAVDPATGTLFVLDALHAQIVRVEPEQRSLRQGAARLQSGRITRLGLEATGARDFRGLAFNPFNGSLYVLSPGGRRLYELTTQGQIVAFYDLTSHALAESGAMVFAPSGDSKSDPSMMSLYANGDPSKIPFAHADPSRMSLYVIDSGCESGGTDCAGRIVELSLAPPSVSSLLPDTSLIRGTVGIQLASSSDDAEESASGRMSLTSTDLELVHDSRIPRDQTIGIRFNGVPIPQGATVTSASIQFQADETQSEATHLTIFAQSIDNAPTFTSIAGNISSRSRTSASITWDPPAWPSVGDAGSAQKSPDLSPIVQEIVNRSGWSSGNSIVFIIKGTGHRTAKAFDGDPSGAPVLIVQVEGTNHVPAVDAGPDQTITLPAGADLNGYASDDGQPDPPAHLTTQWIQISGPDVVLFGDPGAAQTTASFSAPGAYVLRLTASDGDLSASGDVTVIVNAAEESGSVAVRISSSSDDAEESASGSLSLTSSDLELTHDSSDQTVGLRFNGVAVPRGASITRASIQFQADETQSDTTQLRIYGQMTDSASTFTSSSGNISSRARTTASVTWNPQAWTSVGEAGSLQRTPDLSAIVQEIVNRSGWSSGGSIAFVITGTGHRTAVAYEGDPAAAAVLSVVFGGGGTGPDNQPPIVDAGSNRSITLSQSAALAGSVTDDGQPDPPGRVTQIWSKVSGPGTVTFGNSGSAITTAGFSAAGTYVLRLTADDGSLTSSDEATVVVNDATTGGSQVAIYVGYYDTHHPGHRRPKPSPWKGSAGVVFVGKADSSGGWDTSAVRVDNLGSSTLTGVVVTVDIGSHHYALWGTNSIPAGGRLILAQTGADNFDGSDTNTAGCYGCSPSLCTSRVSSTIPVVHVTIGGRTTNYSDRGQILNTHGVDMAGCPYTGSRNDESQAWQRLN